MKFSSPLTALAAARGILFDMDGVLIDSEPTHEMSIITLSGEFGETLEDKDVLASFKGAPEKSMARKMLEIYPDLRLTVDEIVDRNVAIYASLFHHVVLIEGAKDFLATSRATGRKHGLTTSASRSTQELTFSTFGFQEYFETIVTGEDIVHGKPDPEPYLLTAGRLGLSPSECIVIEDSINGVRSGKAAGCTVIAITTTFTRQKLTDAGADFLIDSFSELADVSA